MNVGTVELTALQRVSGVDKEGNETQSIVCVELATGPNERGYWPSPEVVRVSVPATPVIEVPLGARVRFTDFDIVEWKGQAGQGVRRSATSVQVVAPPSQPVRRAPEA